VPAPLQARTLLRDGFDWRFVSNGHSFWFRPALSSERVTMLEWLRAAGKESAAVVRERIIYDRILIASPTVRSSIPAKELLTAVLGLPTPGSINYTPNWERKSLRMIYRAAYLWHFDSRLLCQPCVTCKKYWYDPATGEYASRNGKRLLRPDTALVPCDVPEVGCVKGHHSDPIHATAMIKDCLNRYAEWSASSQFPVDAIAQRNAAAISRARDVANGRRSRRNGTGAPAGAE
jgi:hypothetical protein